jgi:hypothetical protein
MITEIKYRLQGKNGDGSIFPCIRLGKNRTVPIFRKGQSILEYALIVSVVVAALTAMSIYVQRSAQANLKMIENQINAQP